MVTILVYLIIIGLIWYVVDRFLLIPYTNSMIRTVFTIVLIVCVLIWLTNAFGFTHIAAPNVR